MDSSSPNNNKFIPDKPNPDPNQHPLNCPRCDSTNTKFCYYNNYSLSQPRHFCKACKRYWTRGGTLRNVPVGGGCRKNKTIKRTPQPSCGSDGVSGKMISSSLVFSRPIELNNFPFSAGFGSTTRVSLDHNPAARFDHVQSEQQMMINGAGLLGFSSGLMASSQDYNQDPVFTGSSTNSTMATLLSSSLRHQKFVLKEAQANNNFQGLNNLPYDIDQELGMRGTTENAGVKVEGENNNNNRFEQYWNQQQIHDHQQMNMINGSDSSAHLWNTTSTTNLGSWFDPSSSSSNIMGSSVPSLI